MSVSPFFMHLVVLLHHVMACPSMLMTGRVVLSCPTTVQLISFGCKWMGLEVVRVVRYVQKYTVMRFKFLIIGSQSVLINEIQNTQN